MAACNDACGSHSRRARSAHLSKSSQGGGIAIVCAKARLSNHIAVPRVQPGSQVPLQQLNVAMASGTGLQAVNAERLVRNPRAGESSLVNPCIPCYARGLVLMWSGFAGPAVDHLWASDMDSLIDDLPLPWPSFPAPPAASHRLLTMASPAPVSLSNGDCPPPPSLKVGGAERAPAMPSPSSSTPERPTGKRTSRELSSRRLLPGPGPSPHSKTGTGRPAAKRAMIHDNSDCEAAH